MFHFLFLFHWLQTRDLPGDLSALISDEGVMSMEFIDAHLHFGGREDEILGALEIYPRLKDLGLKKAYLLCFTTFDLDFSDVIRVAPYHARPHYHPDYVDANGLLSKVREGLEDSDFVVPFLDFRIIHGDVDAWLARYMPLGYEGLKTLFIPEYDDILKVESPIDILGTTKSTYLDWQQHVMAYAQENNLPLICHLNLQNHFEYAREFLENFPDLRINFPHLGFSRRKMSQLFDTYRNCYSDISGLYEYIEKSPESYKGFTEQYEDRIMFGTDCAWNEASKTGTYLNVVHQMNLNDECRKKLLHEIAIEFLKGGKG